MACRRIERRVRTEEKADVRARAQRLLELLAHDASLAAHDTLAIVTHKGWLREFERGPLGRPHAAEFGNCEVRVFRIALGGGAEPRKGADVTRVHPPEAAVAASGGTDGGAAKAGEPVGRI